MLPLGRVLIVYLLLQKSNIFLRFACQETCATKVVLLNWFIELYLNVNIVAQFSWFNITILIFFVTN